MKTASFGLSDIGRRRTTNEDAFLIDEELGLFVVADGMGGHNAGEIASEQAVETLHGMFQREAASIEALASIPPRHHDEPGETIPPAMRKLLRLMESAIQAATYMVFGLGEANPDQKGMGTTLSVLLLRAGYAITGQVGDSRIYRMREGHAEQVTEDHTLVAWQLKKGLITEDEARNSRQKNVITRAVGSKEYVQVDTHSFPVDIGDRFLLCSDGLHGYIHESEIAALLEGDVEEAANRAVAIANHRGGRDNITAVVAEVEAL
ncbi:MAG: Stp1/IreP family PP2C-type Ser/Thr phosphatase [Myxococcales bacterium]|nr:Stp1/IreP family PP2C-type Ser/Thr phosphatase [Myxococcales bacterium]